MSLAHDEGMGTAARRDLALVGAGVLLFWGVSVVVELNERVLSLTRPWERYQLDELPGVLLFLAAALAWYSWRRVSDARSELRRRVAAEARLAEMLLENRRLSLSHVRVQEDERRQLARELHDELGQHLNAIKIDAVSIRNWSAATSQDINEAARSIVLATDHVQGVIRDMLHRLRPVGLDELGLAAALEHLVAHWRMRNPSTHAVLDVTAPLDDLGEHENITVYRIVQEGLTNVVKHANAQRVSVVLARDTNEGREIVLTIRDDGSGTKDWSSAAGFGLVGMRERVEALGGNLQISSPESGGFSIRATLPVAGRAA